MRTETYLAYFLLILAILISIWPILRIIRFDFWQRGPLPEKKARTPKPCSGHARASITQDVFGNLIPSMQAEATDPIAGLLTKVPVEANILGVMPKASLFPKQ